MIHLFFSFFLMISGNSYGAEATDAKAMIKLIDSLSDLSPESYYTQVDSLRESIEKFLSMKRKVCQGEYSPFILLGQNENPADAKAKLNEKEKRQCYKELRKMHTSYLDNMYSARKRYLESSHKQRLDELARHHELALKELKKSIPD